MSINELFMITPSPVLSALIWTVLAIATLYLARGTSHKAIYVVTHGLHNALRIGARGLNRAEARLSARNREVLLAAGREAKERIIEREFDRIICSQKSGVYGIKPQRVPHANLRMAAQISQTAHDKALFIKSRRFLGHARQRHDKHKQQHDCRPPMGLLL